MSSERREYQRFAVNWRGRVAYDGEVYDVMIWDVSRGGIGVVFPFLISHGAPMSVEFHVKYAGKMCRIRAKTRVVFNTILADNGGAKLGLQFTAVSKDEMHILGNVLQMMGEEDG